MKIRNWKLKGKSRNLITEKPELEDKSENFRAIQETEVQIWKLEGKSGNSSANLETGGQFRKLKCKSETQGQIQELKCKSGNLSANQETQVQIQKLR